jgi:hypothetical protein
MKMYKYRHNTLHLFCTIGLLSSAVCSAILRGAEPQSDKVTVSCAEIPDKVQILGYTGHAIGELITVRGKWRTELSKPMAPIFVVNEVNGKPLATPVEFVNIEPLTDQVPTVPNTDEHEWELRGVETGGFQGYSDAVWRELGKKPAQRAACGFVTRFCYVKSKKLPDPKKARG